MNGSERVSNLRIELLVTADCPRHVLANALLRVTLDRLGLVHVTVHTTVIDTLAGAVRRGFTGSPTILINGADPWPPVEPQSAIACRLYPTADGLPDQQELAAALHAAVVACMNGMIVDQ